MASSPGAIERRQAVVELRGAFMAYMWSFRDRRRKFDTDLSDRQRDRIRAEYLELHRRVDRAYRPVRDLFVAFLGEEPRYDLRHEVDEGGGYDLPVDYPFTRWWDALTIDEAFDKWDNVDEDHVGKLLQRQEAVLEAFENWAGTERSLAQAEPPTLVAPTAAPPARSGRIARALNNPWTVTVGGGTVVIVIAALAVKLL
jgi:hypothetical protein